MSALSPFELTAHLGTLQHSPVGPAGPASIERVQGTHCVCRFPFACGVQGGTLKGQGLLGSHPYGQNPEGECFGFLFFNFFLLGATSLRLIISHSAENMDDTGVCPRLYSLPTGVRKLG